MRCALRRLVPEREKEIMTRFGQKHFIAGVEKGRTEGQASALACLLEKRFGGVPTRDRKRILAADLTSLQTWFERAIDAPDLKSVFRTN
jgi:hypothetical protein